MTTPMPRRAISVAAAAPMPELPPVTTTIFCGVFCVVSMPPDNRRGPGRGEGNAVDLLPDPASSATIR